LSPQAPEEVAFESSVDAPDNLTLRNTCVSVRPAIRVAGELDLNPDLLIVDFGLGAIGLVHVTEALGGEKLAEEAKRHVDQATYLRDLLLSSGAVAGNASFQVDYTVECVLVVAKERLGELTAVVRDLITSTRFLHATGLNLLTYSQDAKVDPYEVERAFAWLLPMTRQKLLDLKAAGGARLQGLQLFNFRLPGQRSWQLNGDRVHLLYGPNGTGKSSIAEALELAVTGSVERFQVNAANDYAKIIRNSQSSGDATISLSLSNGKQPSFTVVPKGLSETPLEKDLPVTAFRLDQTVMDQLLRANSQQRAKVLTRAFFSGTGLRCARGRP